MFKKLPLVLFVILSLQVMPSNSFAQALNLEGRALVFNTSYSATQGSNSASHVRIGYYQFTSADTVAVRHFDFDGSANFQSTETSFSHPIVEDNPNNCVSGPFEVPTNYVLTDETGTYTYNENTGILEISITGFGNHVWALKNSSEEYLELSGNYHVDTPAVSNTINGTTYTNSKGMGYLADSALTNVHVRKANLKPSYTYLLWQSAGNDDEVNSFPWLYVSSGATVSIHKPENQPDPNAKFIAASDANTHSTIGFGLSSIRNIWYTHGGHRFNSTYPCYNTKNGVLNGDGGHKRIIMGIWNADINDSSYVIEKAIGIQYSHESDGRPVLSIERLK